MKNLSIIIPVYKVEPYIGLCVDSVLREAPQNAEIILVDDGSPDACPQICDGYAEKDSRVTVIHQENNGVSGARNAGMRAAKGEYLFFLDSDDYLPKGYFQSLLQSEADLVIGNYTAFYTDGTPEITGDFPTRRYDCLQDFLSDFHKYFPTVFNFVWGKLYKASVIQANGLTFSEGISMGEDVLFNTQYYNCCATVAVQADACVQYRQTAGTLSKRYYPQLFSWYCDSYRLIETLLTENGVFSGENERRFYTRLWGNVFECLLRVNDQSTDEKQKLYAVVVGNTAAKTAAGFCSSRKTALVARAVQKGNVGALKRAMRLYTYLADFKRSVRKRRWVLLQKSKTEQNG